MAQRDWRICWIFLLWLCWETASQAPALPWPPESWYSIEVGNSWDSEVVNMVMLSSLYLIWIIVCSTSILNPNQRGMLANWKRGLVGFFNSTTVGFLNPMLWCPILVLLCFIKKQYQMRGCTQLVFYIQPLVVVGKWQGEGVPPPPACRRLSTPPPGLPGGWPPPPSVTGPLLLQVGSIKPTGYSPALVLLFYKT